MGQWTVRFVRVNGLHLCVRELVAAAHPLVFLHGVGAAGTVWQGLGRRLYPLRRLYAPDLRGHGLSDKPVAGYTPSDYAGDVLGLLDALGLQQNDLLGHSLGAIVAILVAAARPEAITRLVLEDPPLDPAASKEAVRRVYELRHAPPGALEAYLKEQGLSDAIAAAIAQMFRQAADGPFEAVLSARPGYPEAWEALPRIQCPTLVVRADPARGGVLSREVAERVLALLPRGRLLFIPGAEHSVHVSHPREFAQAVRDFLAEEAP